MRVDAGFVAALEGESDSDLVCLKNSFLTSRRNARRVLALPDLEPDFKTQWSQTLSLDSARIRAINAVLEKRGLSARPLVKILYKDVDISSFLSRDAWFFTDYRWTRMSCVRSSSSENFPKAGGRFWMTPVEWLDLSRRLVNSGFHFSSSSHLLIGPEHAFVKVFLE